VVPNYNFPTVINHVLWILIGGVKNHLFVLFFSHALLTAFVSLALALARSQVVVDTIDDLESADVC
jgi:hypothetical protein